MTIRRGHTISTGYSQVTWDTANEDELRSFAAERRIRIEGGTACVERTDGRFEELPPGGSLIRLDPADGEQGPGALIIYPDPAGWPTGELEEER